jgi:hypothetical protein
MDIGYSRLDIGLSTHCSEKEPVFSFNLSWVKFPDPWVGFNFFSCIRSCFIFDTSMLASREFIFILNAYGLASSEARLPAPICSHLFLL